MISAQRIEWNRLDSLNFDLITDLAFDEDNGNSPSFFNQDGIYTEHYDGHRTVHRAKTNEFFNPSFTFIKNDFGDFNMEEQRKILSWLSTDKPGWLNVYHDDSNALSYRCFGTWESIEIYKLGNGRVVGYVATFASTHPYAWSHKFTYPEVHDTIAEINNNDETNDYLLVSGTEKITLTCNSDEYNKLLYPQVTITFDNGNVYFPVDKDPMTVDYKMIPNVIYSWENHLYINITQSDLSDQGKFEILDIFSSETSADPSFANGYYYFLTDQTVRKIVADDNNKPAWQIVSHVGAAIKIDNTYTLNGETIDKEIIIAGGALGETIILNGANKVISSTKNNQLKIVGDNFNWQWPSLVTGENILTVTGNCKIKFEWIEPRKVGSL